MNKTTLGERIKEYRKLARLTQEELGAFFKKSKKTIISWERDSTEPKPSQLIDISALAKQDPAYLLTGEGSPDVNLKDVDTTDIDAVISSYSKDADELSQEDRALLLKVLLEDREDHRNRIQILENYIEHLRGLLDDNQIKYVPLLHRSGTEG